MHQINKLKMNYSGVGSGSISKLKLQFFNLFSVAINVRLQRLQFSENGLNITTALELYL